VGGREGWGEAGGEATAKTKPYERKNTCTILDAWHRPPARSGELSGRTGATRRPRTTRLPLRPDLSSVSLRHTPDPVAFGLAPGPVTGDAARSTGPRTRVARSPTPATFFDRCGPTSEPKRPRAEPAGSRTNAGRGPRSPRPFASLSRHPPGIEPQDLSDRFVGTERFLRRRPRGDSLFIDLKRPDLVTLFGAARPSETP